MTHVLERDAAEPPVHDRDLAATTGGDDGPSRRPRRKLLTPVTGALVAIIVAAGGFIGGVQMQKSRGATATGQAGGMPAGGMPTGVPPGTGGAQASDATTGTVAYTKGDTLYVKDADGNTIKVKVKSSADVNRTVSTDGDAIQPGDSVTVQGTANDKGTVTATAVTATDAGS